MYIGILFGDGDRDRIDVHDQKRSQYLGQDDDQKDDDDGSAPIRKRFYNLDASLYLFITQSFKHFSIFIQHPRL